MDLFDVHRRDVLDFDRYMDLKQPGFGGNESLIYDKDEKGKKIPNKQSENKLKEYRRVVERDPLFKNPHYNSTYKAMSNDLVYKQEGKKPVTYPDPYLTGVATVEVGEYETNEAVSSSFSKFINESNIEGSIKSTIELNDNVEKAMKDDSEKLEKIKKETNNAISEGKCCNFNQFSVISENWYDEIDMADLMEPETETEEEVQVDTDEEGVENPPRRRVMPGPKNIDDTLNLEAAIEDLMNYLGVSREEAANILAIDAIKDLEDKEEREEPKEISRRKFSRKSNDLGDLANMLELGEGPDCYGEGPSC